MLVEVARHDAVRGSSPVVNLAIRTSRPYRRGCSVRNTPVSRGFLKLSGTAEADEFGKRLTSSRPTYDERVETTTRRRPAAPAWRRTSSRTWRVGATARSTRCTTSCSPTTLRQAARLGAGVARERHSPAARAAAAAGPRDPQPAPGNAGPASTPAASACTSGRWCTAPPRPATRSPCGLAPAAPMRSSSTRIACSHFDAYRFFTDTARTLNTLSPGRDDRAAYEQPGCLHATMDLYSTRFACGRWSGPTSSRTASPSRGRYGTSTCARLPMT